MEEKLVGEHEGRQAASPPARSEVAAIKEAADTVKANIQQVMVVKEEVIELMLVSLLCDGHILIEDVPGIGKTTLAKTVARSLGCTFKRIQFTPDLMPSDVTGVNYFNQKQSEFEFRPGPIVTQVLLGDEINRATPRTQSALLEAMEERQITVDGVTMPLPAPFLVIATQNPIELEGTFPLPEAELDRFLIRIKLGYPSDEEEGQLLLRFEDENPLMTLKPVLSAEELVRLQKLVHHVHFDPSLREYVVRLCQASRLHPSLQLGASPRATMALYRTSRALAALRGRDYVLPDDVKSMAPHVLPHRLILNSQTRLRGRTVEVVLEELLASVPVPLEG